MAKKVVMRSNRQPFRNSRSELSQRANLIVFLRRKKSIERGLNQMNMIFLNDGQHLSKRGW
jgi:hypothetical protein